MKPLLIEDSHRLQSSLGAGLVNSGFALDQAFDGEEARGYLAAGGYDVTLDTVARTVTADGISVVLTPHEYALLERLMRRSGQVFSHDRLIERLYGTERDVIRNAVEVQVSALRRKLKAAGVADLVRSRRGFGYVVET